MNKTYACSDLHGMYSLWKQISEYCDDTDIIYFLGDACDRGLDGVKIIMELLKDPRVKYIKGNHEDLLTLYVPYLLEGHFEYYPEWVMNGGQPTWEILSKFSEESILYICRQLDKLPLSATYINKQGQKIFLSHAGTDLNHTEEDYRLRGDAEKYLLWDRKHIYFSHPQEEEFKNVYQVHGHTPVSSLENKLTIPFNERTKNLEVLSYCDGRKIDIDLGCFSTAKTALIDLDDLENVKYFYDLEILGGEKYDA